MEPYQIKNYYSFTQVIFEDCIYTFYDYITINILKHWKNDNIYAMKNFCKKHKEIVTPIEELANKNNNFKEWIDNILTNL